MAEEKEEVTIKLENPPKKRRKNAADNPNNSRQKYCQNWEREFDWLKAHNLDESLGLCTVCDQVLVCKKSQLQRHQRSFKHQQHLGFVVVENSQQIKADFYDDNSSRMVEDEDLNFIIDERDSTSNLEMDAENSIEFDVNPLNENENGSRRFLANNSLSKNRQTQNADNSIVSAQLLQRIESDKRDLENLYKSRYGIPYAGEVTASAVAVNATPTVVKDNFDLFFESISASVKLLPPRLAAECKSGMSHLLAEYELRAICEMEQGHVMSVGNNVTVASTTDDFKA